MFTVYWNSVTVGNTLGEAHEDEVQMLASLSSSARSSLESPNLKRRKREREREKKKEGRGKREREEGRKQ